MRKVQICCIFNGFTSSKLGECFDMISEYRSIPITKKISTFGPICANCIKKMYSYLFVPANQLIPLYMGKSEKYPAAARSINMRRIKQSDEIFKIIPKHIVSKELHMSPDVLDKKLKQIEKFYLGDIFELAALFGVDNIVLLEIAAKQHQSNNQQQ
jgi:hypothetical protein